MFNGVDALRYYMVREIEFGKDGTFTPRQFVDRRNADLANTYGNLVNRALSMIKKYFNGVIPEYKEPQSDLTKKVYADVQEKINQYNIYRESLEITSGVAKARELIALGNKYFDDIAPWSCHLHKTPLRQSHYHKGILQSLMRWYRNKGKHQQSFVSWLHTLLHPLPLV